MTYEEVAYKIGLKGRIKDRYVRYMRTRWAESEEQKCYDGYAEEWAERFRNKVEFNCSDSTGRAVLKEIGD